MGIFKMLSSNSAITGRRILKTGIANFRNLLFSSTHRAESCKVLEFLPRAGENNPRDQAWVCVVSEGLEQELKGRPGEFRALGKCIVCCSMVFV